MYFEDPSERLLKPLCAAVAYEVLGDPRKLEEVRERVETTLEEGRRT